MSESVQTVLMYIGGGTVLIFAFLVFCLLLFSVIIMADRWQEHRKSRFSKHQKGGDLIRLPTPVNADFFEKLSQEEIELERQAQEQLELARAAEVEALRLKLARNDQTVVNVAGWDQEQFLDDSGATVSYPFETKGDSLESSRGAHKA